MLFCNDRCDYMEEDCPNGCGQRLPRHALPVHKTRKCKKRPIEEQLECLSQEMMDKLAALEAKYEEKVSMLGKKLVQQEEKLMLQEKKLVQQEEKLAKQEEKLVQQKENFMKEQKEIMQINDTLCKELEGEKKHIFLLEEAKALCRDDIEGIKKQLKGIEDRLLNEVEFPVSQKALKIFPNWTGIKENIEASGVTLVDSSTGSIKLIGTSQGVKYAESVLNSFVEVSQFTVSPTPKKKEVLQYLFQSEDGKKVISKLESKYSVSVQPGKL